MMSFGSIVAAPEVRSLPRSRGRVGWGHLNDVDMRKGCSKSAAIWGIPAAALTLPGRQPVDPLRTLRDKPFHRDFSYKFGLHYSLRSPIRMSGCTRYCGGIAHVSISPAQSKRNSFARKVDGVANCPRSDFSNPGGSGDAAAHPAAAHPAAARPAAARTGGAG